MKKNFNFFAFFVLGIIFNNLISAANAYMSNSIIGTMDIYDFNSAVERIVDDKISSYDYNFSSEVENVIEKCSVDEGSINC